MGTNLEANGAQQKTCLTAGFGILDSPEIYSEYAPYTYIEDMKEFIDKVAQMNRVA